MVGFLDERRGRGEVKQSSEQGGEAGRGCWSSGAGLQRGAMPELSASNTV